PDSGDPSDGLALQVMAADAGNDAVDAAASDGAEAGAADAGAIRFVQVGYVTCGSKTTCELALPSPVVTGDALLVIVAVYLTPTVSLTDTLGHNYNFVLGPVDDPSYRSYIAAAFNTRSGANTLRATASSVTDIYIWAAEYSGVTGFD